jgi:hypothetical protein
VVKKKEDATRPPLFGGTVEAVLFLLVAITVLAVIFGYSTEVNRVFDVTKATYLKYGGGAALLLWLAWGTFGPGFRWRSMRLFAAPVVALLVAVGISTILSIDPITSEVGVYERQFGFQGYLACTGLFFAAATGLASPRGAFLGLGLLAAVAGLVGTYAHLQGFGLDPLGFFREPDDKVWAFLGNATFAGNSLALLFPMTVLLAGTATVRAVRSPEDGRARGGAVLGVLIGLAVVLSLQVVLGRAIGAMDDVSASKKAYAFCASGSLLFMLGCAALGSGGPDGLRADSPAQRRVFDQLLAGALVACVVGVMLGLFHSRTRAAWVGSAVAVAGGSILLPYLFSDVPALKRRVRTIAWGTLAGLLVVGTLWATLSDDKYARTVRSIPAAFDPERTDYGKGQGTRPYLWRESVRVLTRHDETLERLDRDREDYRARVDPELLDDIPVRELPPASWSESPWREIGVWLFGIGIETYRYAFMSHKSLELEAMDPMTNHDNPHNNYLYLFASLGIVGLAAYLWLLTKLLVSSFIRFIDERRSRTERALAFGIVTSFFSYAVYSIAGFDSIASSVFLYTLLGVASVLFEPNHDGVREPLGSALLRSWQRVRGREAPRTIPRPVVLSLVVAALVGGLGVRTIYSARRVMKADQTVVRPPKRGENPRTIGFNIRTTKEAIAINPHESFYRQQLGSLYAQQARAYQQRAAQAQREGDEELARRALKKAREVSEKGLAVLMSALHHAWAPENIFITAFQIHYQMGRIEEAMNALERAFDHSPHLGELRAQLAALQVERGEYDAALENCRYAIEAGRNTPSRQRRPTAHLVCGRVLAEREQFERARRHLKRAKAIAPKDPRVSQYLELLKRQRAAARTSTSS